MRGGRWVRRGCRQAKLLNSPNDPHALMQGYSQTQSVTDVIRELAVSCENRPMFDEPSNQISYLKIMFAVCGGILLARVISLLFGMLVLGAAIDTGAAHIDQVAASAERDIRDSNERSRREAEQRRRIVERQRADSPTGRSLSRKCRDLAEFLKENPGIVAQQQKNTACRNYEVFLETGSVPTRR